MECIERLLRKGGNELSPGETAALRTRLAELERKASAYEKEQKAQARAALNRRISQLRAELAGLVARREKSLDKDASARLEVQISLAQSELQRLQALLDQGG